MEDNFIKLEKNYLDLQVLFEDENANSEALIQVIEIKEKEVWDLYIYMFKIILNYSDIRIL